MAVEHDHRFERWVTANSDGHMPPLFVDDVEEIVVDERHRLAPLDVDAATGEAQHTPHRSRQPRHDHREDAAELRIGGDEFLGDAVLALPLLAVDHRNAVRLGPS
ncbi:MAG: hypothetical protein ACUVQQ_15600, partial [Thermogutta sp.]